MQAAARALAEEYSARGENDVWSCEPPGEGAGVGLVDYGRIERADFAGTRGAVPYIWAHLKVGDENRLDAIHKMAAAVGIALHTRDGLRRRERWAAFGEKIAFAAGWSLFGFALQPHPIEVFWS